LPEGAGPSTRHKSEVNALHPTIKNIHDEQVAKDQEDQDDPGYPHEQPAIELEVAALLIA
jgi:hypothetical protein